MAASLRGRNGVLCASPGGLNVRSLGDGRPRRATGGGNASLGEDHRGVAGVWLFAWSASAAAADRPDPTLSPAWTISGSSTPDETNSQTNVAAAQVWQCTGDAFTPEIVRDTTRTYVLYQAAQVCTGTFGTQQVCVKLQQRDYFGNFYDRTTYRCSAFTPSAYGIANGTVTCGALGHETFRAYGRGVAGTTPKVASQGPGGSATLC